MSFITNGERTLERFCQNHNICYEKIKVGKLKTPDYKLFINNEITVIIELKDITTNSVEEDAIKQSQTQKTVVWGGSIIGARIRNKIDKSKKQLKDSLSGNVPKILLLYDDREGIAKGIFEYEISVGMYGLETREISNGHITKRHGRRQLLSSKHKTYISYLGILENDQEITLYENYYGINKVPDSVLIEKRGFTCFRLKTAPNFEIAKWIKIE